MESAVGIRLSTPRWTAMLESVPSAWPLIGSALAWLGMAFTGRDPSLAVKEVKPNGLVAEHNWRGHTGVGPLRSRSQACRQNPGVEP